MPRFLACHTVPGVTQQMLEQMAQAAQKDTQQIKGISSYTSLSEGVVHCIFEAPSKEVLANWFNNMKLPYDRITKVELEGSAGTFRKV